MARQGTYYSGVSKLSQLGGTISDAQHGARTGPANAHQHAAIGGLTANDHHAQSHAISGADHSGTLAHAATSGRTPNDHHAQSHSAADHSSAITKTNADFARIVLFTP